MSRSDSARGRSRSSPPAQLSKALNEQQRSGESAPRDTGIRVIGDAPWGTHICLFYETKEDLIDAAISFFKAGLESNEFCVWAISEPITDNEAKAALRRVISDFDERLAAGQIELLPGREWYLKSDEFDMKRVTGGWQEKLENALASGYEGMRASGNAFWIATKHWKEFREYEDELERSLAGQKMVVLCTYPLHASRAVDILDVARAHQCSIARRHGAWDFLETPELKQAKREIQKLTGALDILSKPFPGHKLLTPRERVALAHIVRGASSKEAGRALGISPRTVEFHRANIMQKLGTKNTAALVRKVMDS